MLNLKQSNSSTPYARELMLIDGMHGLMLRDLVEQMCEDKTCSTGTVFSRYENGWGEKHPDPRVLLLASCFCESFGDAVMWAFWCKRFESWSEFVEFVQEGIPSANEMQEAWDSQKLDGNSLLDTVSWEILQEKCDAM